MSGVKLAQYDEYIAQHAAEEARGSGPLRWNLGGYLEHWSPSSLAMLLRCPYQWQQRYIHKRKERPGEAKVTGTSVHTGLQRNFEWKIETHEDIPVQELLEWYDDEGFGTVVALEEERSEAETAWDTSPADAHRRGRAMLSGYRQQVAPRIVPLAVETKVEAHFGVAVPVIGYIDLERDETSIDFKTGKRRQSEPKADWRIQAAVYTEAKGKPLEFHSISATEKNTVTILTPLESENLLVHPTPAERKHMNHVIRALSARACLYMELYGPDMPWPTDGIFHDWACRYCGYRSGCPAWAGRE